MCGGGVPVDVADTAFVIHTLFAGFSVALFL